MFHFLFESCFVDEAGAKGSQQLFEFKIFVHGKSSKSSPNSSLMMAVGRL
jgi:hypothetical protein